MSEYKRASWTQDGGAVPCSTFSLIEQNPGLGLEVDSGHLAVFCELIVLNPVRHFFLLAIKKPDAHVPARNLDHLEPCEGPVDFRVFGRPEVQEGVSIFSQGGGLRLPTGVNMSWIARNIDTRHATMVMMVAVVGYSLAVAKM